MNGNIGNVLAADSVAQGCLRGKCYGVVVILDLHAGFFGIPHHPEYGSIHVDRNEVGREGFFGAEAGEHDALVGAQRYVLDEGNGPVESWADGSVEFSQP